MKQTAKETRDMQGDILHYMHRMPVGVARSHERSRAGVNAVHEDIR
jgi:hypothetical protein